MIYNVIIAGSGPAGLTSAIYTSRANLEPLLFEGITPGGPLMTTTGVENFPGFPEGIQGPDLVLKMKAQAEKFGTKIISKNVVDVDLSSHPFKVYVGEEKEEYQTKSLIIATGTEPRKLGLESEKRLSGRGVSYCATCDGPLFKDKVIVVVGGGDTSMEEALFLSKFGKKIYVLVRKDALRASDIMQDRVKKNEKIEVMFNTEIKDIVGEQKVEKIKIVNNKTNKEDELDVGGIFVAIGRIPNTKMFEGKLDMEKGYIVTQGESAKTSVKGVYAAGDVSEWNYWQAITAAGKGCMAAKDAERFLEETE